jgi:2Fe-2S iron-sulfur cluster binding domain
MATTIKVNGVDRTVDVDSDTSLLWVLRDVLGMTGTKFGCGMALCGACTVHVDGVATRSCITTVDGTGTSEITMIEAIGATAAGAKIQKAWLDREVFNAATANRARSCPPRPCLRATHIRRMAISTMRCPAISAAAGPMSAFARPSSKPRNRPDSGADNDPRSSHPAQLAAGRSGRVRRSDA